MREMYTSYWSKPLKDWELMDPLVGLGLLLALCNSKVSVHCTVQKSLLHCVCIASLNNSRVNIPEQLFCPLHWWSVHFSRPFHYLSVYFVGCFMPDLVSLLWPTWRLGHSEGQKVKPAMSVSDAKWQQLHECWLLYAVFRAIKSCFIWSDQILQLLTMI